MKQILPLRLTPAWSSAGLLLTALFVSCIPAGAQPTLLSSVPAYMDSGVSPTASIVFTFSEAMNPALTYAQFMDTQAPLQPLPMQTNWSADKKVLTYTPTTPLTGGHMIYWVLAGESLAGEALVGDPAGIFTVAAGLGCDPSAPMASFTVGKGWSYVQNSAGAPELNNTPYCFVACMTLPCPRDATNVLLQTPNTFVRLAPTPISGHAQSLDCRYLDATAFEAAYGPGSYIFTIQSVTNQTVTVNFPSTLTQPPAPHISNYAAAQTIDASEPFTVTWDAMAGGTVADVIYIEINGGTFKTGAPGEPGTLNGLATSATIPGGTLQAGQVYSGFVTFYKLQIVTNGTSYVTLTYRASSTAFDLHTASGQASRPVLSNPRLLNGKLTFDVSCSAGQLLYLESCSSLGSAWSSPIAFTNALGSLVRLQDPQPATSQKQFYRVRVGP